MGPASVLFAGVKKQYRDVPEAWRGLWWRFSPSLPPFDMLLITILNQCHRFPGFVYQWARFSIDRKTIEVSVRPRRGSAAICSGCHQPTPGYDQLDEWRFEFIPLWGFLVFFLYRMRRVNCRQCGVVVEEVRWGSGKHHLWNEVHSEIRNRSGGPRVSVCC